MMRRRIPLGNARIGLTVLLSSLIAGCASKRTPDALRTSTTVQDPFADVRSKEPAVQFGEKLVLHSRILNEDRPYWVYLPESYHSSRYHPKRYAVLYILDGDSHFQWACGVVRFMSIGWNLSIQTPELIIVAIPNTGTNRTRDLTPTKASSASASLGGGDAFLKFIETELIPSIDSQYRTMPFRILAGHSLGGLFAMDAFLHRPSVFNGYIAIDPYLDWEDQALLKKANETMLQATDLQAAVYISLAGPSPAKTGGPDEEKEASIRFAAMLTEIGSPMLRSRLQHFESEDHSTVPLVSLYHGLQFIFEGYKPSLGVMFGDPSALGEHFRKVSERIGLQFLPPEHFVNETGYFLLYQAHKTNKAIECFRLNAAIYPLSPNAHASLGEGYAVSGDNVSARACFEKALKLEPNNPKAKKWLEKH